jgi:hypothetical protein
MIKKHALYLVISHSPKSDEGIFYARKIKRGPDCHFAYGSKTN